MTSVNELGTDQGSTLAARPMSRRAAAWTSVVCRPGLLERLGSARVTVVSASPGSGKTVLLRSWIGEAGLAERAGWVTVSHGERDPQQFWLAVLEALRQTVPGSALVRALTAAPDLDGWAIVERLLKDLAPLDEPLWLVIDDLHELGSDQARRQLELLLMRAPAELRFVLVTRHDVQLGLHRLRLEGELAEIRADDLRFSLDEARALLAASGVRLTEPVLALLVDRTEGWAAGLRLAALSLAGHPDPDRFAAEFSGTERTVAEYLLAEVLDRQPAEVRRLLLRTSILERVDGELADLLTGGSGGERVLHDLEEANAFVMSLDAGRSWFRYHHLFAGLLRLELRRTEPDQVTALHRLAATWLAAHGYAVEAVRHAQAARDWPLAARLLAGHWPTLYLGGQAATIHELLAGFPVDTSAADAGLAAVAAADELAQGSLEAAERYLELAERGLASVADDRRRQARVLLGVVRLLVARQRGNPSAVAEEAQRLQALAEALEATQPCLGDELRALTLVSLGITEVWAVQFEEAQRHLEDGVALARRIGRPYLEYSGLAYQAVIELVRSSYAPAVERSEQAIKLAERHGWTDEPAAGHAYVVLAGMLGWQGRAEEADHMLQRAERSVKAEAEPAAALLIAHIRGVVEMARGRLADALAAFQTEDRLAGRLAAPHLLVPSARALILYLLVHLGETERAEQVLAGLDARERDHGEMRIAIAALRLAQGDPHEALVTLEPVVDGAAPQVRRTWLIEAHLVEAMTRDALGDQAEASRALERALDLAEPVGATLTFLKAPAGLLERQARGRTAHAALIARILDQLAGGTPAPPSAGPRPPSEPVSDSELRVLRYLPTHLSAPEIAAQLSVSTSTVKTHLRNLYAKLGVHSRAEAVERARALGMLAPSARSPA